jgi:hypothetical protein
MFDDPDPSLLSSGLEHKSFIFMIGKKKEKKGYAD